MKKFMILIPFLWSALFFRARAGHDVVVVNVYQLEAITLAHETGNTMFWWLLQYTEHYKEANDYKSAAKNTVFSVRVNGMALDLNADGIKDILVPFACGNKVCAIAVFEGKTLRPIGEFEGVWIKIDLKKMRNGFALIWVGYSKRDFQGLPYVYKGNTYQMAMPKKHQK